MGGLLRGDQSASALYVENWHLASAAVDYQALGDAPSPVQHFWSLSVEEQFYLVWPLLILAALLAGRRWIAPVLAFVTVSSLAWSAIRTGSDPASAYFVTPTRAWEFGVGGLLALVPLARPSRALTVAGLGAVGVAAVAFGEGTAFPGVAALVPVLGAAAVIHARALAWRPLERLGDVSYAVYLWHWPLIVLMAGTSRVVLLALTLALAALTKVLVEDPIRRLRARPRLTFVPAAAGTLAVLLLAASGTAALDDRVEQERLATKRVLAHKPSCFGAAAVARRCRAPEGVVPAPVVAEEAPNAPCHILAISDKVVPCGFGVAPGRGDGDGRADRRQPRLPLARRARPGGRAPRLARDLDRAVALPVRGGRPRPRGQRPRGLPGVARAGPALAGEASRGHDRLRRPVHGRRRDRRRLRRAAGTRCPRASSGSSSCATTRRCSTREGRSRASSATRTTRRRAARAGATPRCSPTRPRRPPARTRARRSSTSRGSSATRRTCSPVIGGALVHKDSNHLTSVYAATLAPYLGRAVDVALGV